MKTSVVIATCIVCWLIGGYSNYSRAGELESALENINISTDLENAPTKAGKVNHPCAKVAGEGCLVSHDEVNTNNTSQDLAIQGAVVDANIQRITINGVSAGQLDGNGVVSVGGF